MLLLPKVPTYQASSLAVSDCLGFRAPWFPVVQYVRVGGIAVFWVCASPRVFSGVVHLFWVSSSSGVTLPGSPGYAPSPLLPVSWGACLWRGCGVAGGRPKPPFRELSSIGPASCKAACGLRASGTAGRRDTMYPICGIFF